MKYALISLGLCLLVACHPNRVFEQHTKMDDLAWKQENVISFQVNIEDNSTPYNFLVAIRHASGFPYQNLLLTFSRTTPSGKKETQEHELRLADENGDYLGDGMGDFWDFSFPLETGKMLEETGMYTLELKHDMPRDPLPLIMEVGLIVEKVVEE